jgi:hypothetical protein
MLNSTWQGSSVLGLFFRGLDRTFQLGDVSSAWPSLRAHHVLSGTAREAAQPTAESDRSDPSNRSNSRFRLETKKGT